MTVWYRARYLDLHCSSESFNQLARAEIQTRVEQTVARLPCVERGSCRVSELTVTDCNIASGRRRRGNLAMGFQLSLSTTPEDGQILKLLCIYINFYKIIGFRLHLNNCKMAFVVD